VGDPGGTQVGEAHRPVRAGEQLQGCREFVVSEARHRSQYGVRAFTQAVHTQAYPRLVSPRGRNDSRLSREDWEIAALDAIADGGLTAVAVEPLARGLGVTKGSFYAHFASREELVVAALARWEHSHGQAMRDSFGAIEDPRARLRALLRTAVEFSQSRAPSVHVRLMAEVQDPHVRAALRRVTGTRLEGIERTYRELGLTPAAARHRARLLYAAYVGLLQLAHESPEGVLSPRQLERFLAEAEPALIP
jgi:AcrR family transcriptional regulator